MSVVLHWFLPTSGDSRTVRWSSMAMRDSAACGSPCEPVQMHTTSCAG